MTFEIDLMNNRIANSEEGSIDLAFVINDLIDRIIPDAIEQEKNELNMHYVVDELFIQLSTLFDKYDADNLVIMTTLFDLFLIMSIKYDMTSAMLMRSELKRRSFADFGF